MASPSPRSPLGRISLSATLPAPIAKTARTATTNTQNPDAAMTGKMMAAAAGLLGEGHGSKVPQFLQLALEAGPGYHLARVSDQMICYGTLATSCCSRRIPA